jgi:hypothetical protein
MRDITRLLAVRSAPCFAAPLRRETKAEDALRVKARFCNPFNCLEGLGL